MWERNKMFWQQKKWTTRTFFYCKRESWRHRRWNIKFVVKCFCSQNNELSLHKKELIRMRTIAGRKDCRFDQIAPIGNRQFLSICLYANFERLIFLQLSIHFAQSADSNLDYYNNLNAIFRLFLRYSEVNSNNPEKKCWK